ncbi:MAG: ribbon-helix-helix protein, CopG family [Desulfurococcales archaeon]|jgi:CopG family nickel-responsive transcriptional regulator|uniref:Putative nickel-responsive regulator n=1 Tax=Fervidicoccus fontis TaxID=683846 RepID=A0A7C1E3U2_9CREN|nr:ribbon-helix-helix protein, CopG family [Desulfurococcales archaeon]
MRKPRLMKTGVTIPEDLLMELESLAGEMGIKSRSMAIQMAIRHYIATTLYQLKKEGKLAGAVVVHYDHQQHTVEELLTDIQHDFMDIIPASMHIHVTREDCLLVIGIKGDSSRIRQFIEKLYSMVKAKQVLVSLTPV